MFPLSSLLRGREDSRGRYAHLTPNLLEDFPGPRSKSRWSVGAFLVGIHQTSVTRIGKRRGPLLLSTLCFALLVSSSLLLWTPLSWVAGGWPNSPIFGPNDIRTIWEWEVRSGHYPSKRPIPAEVGFTTAPSNPAIPRAVYLDLPTHSEGGIIRHTIGTGVERMYPGAPKKAVLDGYPPRPVAGSITDLDRILEHCDFEMNKYVRDCLEILRLDAGLDGPARLRRGDVRDLRHVYLLDGKTDGSIDDTGDRSPPSANTSLSGASYDQDHNHLPPDTVYGPFSNEAATCSEDEPRVFHMFWAGPFTDKPYMALLAFLFTQNLGLHLDTPPLGPSYCRPQLWLWVSLGPSEAMPSPTAEHDMYEELLSNAWASPLLHPRFKDVIRFRLWNTTEQLDSLPELKDEWRNLGHDFLRSDGGAVDVDPEKNVGSPIALNGTGKETWKTYSKVPVVLSDLVRFVLCHRFGGIYLDIDLLLLRDWEELWNWPGAFAYRWSWKDAYNTAVFRLRRGSALGTFFLRTALANQFDFHPLTISRYLKDAHMEELLFRVPDALFDPNWLAADSRYVFPWGRQYFQRDRPPQPHFADFDYFFNTPSEMSGMPIVIGFDGFFRGAYSYHFHNEWWKPFDRARFYPDLGPRFADAARMGREAIVNGSASYQIGIVSDDEQDLTWATVLKRTFEAYIRGEQPNMYGEWIKW